jgi:hypothetical protein
MTIKPNKAFNDLPLLPPKESLVETISILKQESKSAVALAELKGLTNTLPNPNISYQCCDFKRSTSEFWN